MKTILVDAWNTFVTETGINQDLYEMLESFPNPKIILTNANTEEKERFGIVNMPYEVFSLEHNPDKPNPEYYKKMLTHFGFHPEDVVYFEHNPSAVISAQSVGIQVFQYDKEKKDVPAVRTFISQNL